MLSDLIIGPRVWTEAEKQILYLTLAGDLGHTNLGYICDRCNLDFEHTELDLVHDKFSCYGGCLC